MNKHIEKLIKLSKENPEMEIITMTAYEVVAEDWGYWKGFIESVEIEEFYENIQNEMCWMLFGEEDIVEELCNQVEDYEGISDAELEERAYILYEKYKKDNKIKNAIIIRINI